MRRALALAVAVGVVFGVAGCGGGGDPNVLACQQWGDAFHGGGGDALVAGARAARDGAVGVVATAMRRAVDHPDVDTFVSVQRVCRDVGVAIEYPG